MYQAMLETNTALIRAAFDSTHGHWSPQPSRDHAQRGYRCACTQTVPMRKLRMPGPWQVI